MVSIHIETRMHSSRMRTGRSLTVCCSLLPRGEVSMVGGGAGSPWSWGGFSLVRGESAWSRGVLLGLRGVSAWSPWSQGGFSRDLPTVDRITDTCKNITLATTSLRPVKRMCGMLCATLTQKDQTLRMFDVDVIFSEIK